jgi:uncharacterized repeat protein (TIGR01451 family)
MAPAARAQAEENADLSALASAAAETTADTDLAFSITASNLGPDPADAATVSVPVPAGATFVSLAQDAGPAFSCTTPGVGAGGSVTCDIATLAAATDASFTLTVHVDADAPRGSYISATATVSTSTFDPNEENNAGTGSTLVGPVTVADLGVSQSAPEGAVPGSVLTYAITMTNGGPAAADATVTDPLPGATTFVSLDAPAGWSCTTPAVGNGGTADCTHPSLPAGATQAFTLVVHIPPDTPSGEELFNRVTVSTGASDPNTENDEASTNTVVSSADLRATVSGPPAVTAGDALTYTITVTNDGPDAALSVQVVDTLPAGLTFLSLTQASGPAFALSAPGVGQSGTVGMSIGVLTSGASAQFALAVASDPRTADGTELADTAAVSAPTGDPDPADNADSATTEVTGLAADLEVRSSGPATTGPGHTLTYTLTLTNGGPDTAYDVALADAMPDHSRFGSFVQTSGPSFELVRSGVAGKVMVRAIRAELASGETAGFTLKVIVDPSAADGATIDNATRTLSAISDPDASDNRSSVSTTVVDPATPAPAFPVPLAGATPVPAQAPIAVPRVVVCRHVPRLKGMTLRGVKRTLKRRGCRVKLRHGGPLRRKSGSHTRVRSQRPRGGTTVYRGQRIRLTLR